MPRVDLAGAECLLAGEFLRVPVVEAHLVEVDEPEEDQMALLMGAEAADKPADDDMTEENGTAYIMPFSKIGIRTLVEHVRDEASGDRVGYFGSERDGGFAEYTVAGADYCFPIPDGFDDLQAAPLLCAGIIGYRALERSGVPAGGRIALYGFGSSAHVVLQLALHRGRWKIYSADGGERFALYDLDADPGEARDLSREHPSVLAGLRAELDAWRAEGVVDVLGHRSDVADIFADANIVVLPSYYGEGLPKVLIEAAACARARCSSGVPSPAAGAPATAISSEVGNTSRKLARARLRVMAVPGPWGLLS